MERRAHTRDADLGRTPDLTSTHAFLLTATSPQALQAEQFELSDDDMRLLSGLAHLVASPVNTPLGPDSFGVGTLAQRAAAAGQQDKEL